MVPDAAGPRVEGPVWIHRLGPDGAERSTWAEGVAAGGLRISVQEGLVVVVGRARRVVDCIEPDEVLSVGPDGALAIAGGTLRLAPPSRTPVEVETEVDASSIHWSRSGRQVRVTTPDGAALVDVTTRVRRSVPAARTPALGSCALAGHVLAGPGGRLWDLRAGAPIRGPRVRLGATVAAGESFANVDWETHEGRWLTGGAEVRFALPLDPEDTTVGAAWDGERALFVSAEGRSFAVRPDGAVEEIDELDIDEPERVSVVGPLGDLRAEGTAVVDGRRFVWSVEGGLYGWPEPPFSSEISQVR